MPAACFAYAVLEYQTEPEEHLHRMYWMRLELRWLDVVDLPRASYMARMRSGGAWGRKGQFVHTGYV